MKFSTLFLAVPALVLAMGAAHQDPAKLSRTYKENAVHAYGIKVNADFGGQVIQASAKVNIKVAKLLEKGASVVCSMQNVNVTLDGNSMGEMTVDDFEAEVDATAMPDRVTVSQADWMYTLTLLSGILPGKEVKPGESFDLEWSAKDKSATAKGKGKLVEVSEKDGAKVAKLEVEMEIRPGHEGTGTWKSTSYVALDDGRLVSSEGTIEVSNQGTMKFEIGASK